MCKIDSTVSSNDYESSYGVVIIEAVMMMFVESMHSNTITVNHTKLMFWSL